MNKPYIFSIFVLFISILIEAAVLSNISVLPAIPDLLLICTLYFSVNNGCVHGQTMGFISGLFVDFVSGGPFGLNCLVRTIIGYVLGFFKKMFNLKSIFVTFLIGLAGTIIKALLIRGTSFFFPNMINTYNIFSSVFIFELIINSILTPIVFKFLDCFSDFIIISDRI